MPRSAAEFFLLVMTTGICFLASSLILLMLI
jgi:hypothetical protein